MFFKGSRYADVDSHELTGPDRRRIRYKGIRLIPATPARSGHAVRSGERLDHIAHRYYKDSERFWRICDANLAMWPDDLTAAPGEIISIPSAEG